jgi:D-3-phosphoglycerate dehydrogenase
VALPREDGQSRLLHLHVNTPGVLAAVNGLLAEHGVNIEGQLLSTKGSLGYVVTDIAGAPTADVVQALQGMAETVRLRVL